jgi:hypothetical protein
MGSSTKVGYSFAIMLLVVGLLKSTVVMAQDSCAACKAAKQAECTQKCTAGRGARSECTAECVQRECVTTCGSDSACDDCLNLNFTSCSQACFSQPSPRKIAICQLQCADLKCQTQCKK